MYEKEHSILIKEKLKELKFVRNAYISSYRFAYKTLYNSSPVLASKVLYKKTTKKSLNLKKPLNFNEKLQWLKLYWQHPLVAQCADKYEMYEYVKSCGEEEILNELYSVYNHPSEINWDELPEKFALKCTHGCGYNIICDNKQELDKKEAQQKLNSWLKEKYGEIALELHYDKITPRIIAEKYIETDVGLLPNDYKIYCFDGKAQLVLVCSDRADELKLNFMDIDWNIMDIGVPSYTSEGIPEMPKCFNKMVEYAEKLSKPFPFVRVDFYDFNGKPVLGEMTFTPAGCMATYYNEKGLNLLGEMLVLPNEKIV